MFDAINHERGHLSGAVAMTIAAVQLGMTRRAAALANKTRGTSMSPIKSGANTPFATLKQIDAVAKKS